LIYNILYCHFRQRGTGRSWFHNISKEQNFLWALNEGTVAVGVHTALNAISTLCLKKENNSFVWNVHVAQETNRPWGITAIFDKT